MHTLRIDLDEQGEVAGREEPLAVPGPAEPKGCANIYIYIYIHMYVCMYVYIYIYICKERERER